MNAMDSLLALILTSPARRAQFWQLARFGITGVGLTLFTVGLAYVLEHYLAASALLAIVLATAVAMCMGYVAHSQWSFKGHGTRDNLPMRLLQFVCVNFIGLAMNMGFTWVLREHYHMSAAMGYLPIIFITPLVSYGLNRAWVFS